MSRHFEVVGLCAVGLSVLIGIHVECTLRAQEVPQSPARFDVVSIKPNQSGADGNSIRPEPGGRFVATNVTAKMLLRIAFDNKSTYSLLHEYQIVGGPRWTDSRHFDIHAQGASLSNERLSAAVRAMLADRFALRAHRETREQSVYALVRTNRAATQLQSADPTAPATPPRPGLDGQIATGSMPPPGRVHRGAGTLAGSAVPLADLAYNLSSLLDRAVLDRTGLTGVFNFHMHFAADQPSSAASFGAPSPSAATGEPSIFTAVQEQLGLRLDASRGPVDVVVIDQIREPSDN